MTRNRKRQWLLFAFAFISIVIAGGVVLLTGVGPSLPGPHVRELLGLDDSVDACEPDQQAIRRPRPHTAATWSPVRPLPALEDEPRAVGVGRWIFFGGGLDREGSGVRSLSTFYRFDTARQTYRRLADLPIPLDHLGIAAYGGDVFIAGGYSNGRPTAKAWRYSPRLNRWSALPRMTQARGAVAAAAIGHRIYVTGGSPIVFAGLGDDVRTTLEIYDVFTRRWTRGPSMPTARHHHGVAALHGRLFVVGGRGSGDLSLANVETFDPAQNRWEPLPSLPQGVGGTAAVTLDGEVVVVGGGDDRERWVTPAVWAYEPQRGTWRRLPDLRLARHGHAVAASGSHAYVLGGSPCPGFGSTDSVEMLVK